MKNTGLELVLPLELCYYKDCREWTHYHIIELANYHICPWLLPWLHRTPMNHLMILLPILNRRHAGFFFEQFREVKVRFEVELEGNFFNRFRSIG